jgi:uncharacterized iron-regulated protein
MKKIMLFVLALLFIFYIGCTSSISQIDLAGTWGGEHISLTVLDSTANLEFDCAHGNIYEPISIDTEGNFEVTGIYVIEHGGPIRIDETLEKYPSLYKGRIEGEKMTLILILKDTETEIDSFWLTRGAEPIIYKCL